MIRHLWQVVGGDVRVAVDEAEWWGASLSALIAAVHHPAALATCRPESDPVEVARDVLADVDDLYAAAAVAEAQARRADPGDRPASVSVRRDGAEIVFAPGAEVANLAWCLELFASAVVDPGGADAAVARGATAYAASAWSADVGKAAGTIGAGDPPRQRGTSSEPAAVNRSHDRRAASESRSAPVSALRPRPAGRVVRVGSRLVRSGRARSSTPPCLMGRRYWPVLPVAGVSSAEESGCRRSCQSPGQAPAIPPRRSGGHHWPRMAAAPESEAAMIRQAWAERARPRRRERVAGVHPAG
jgi:hypothetical protein